MRLNDNDDLKSIYFILLYSARYSNCYQNVFINSSFAKSIWFYYVIKFLNFLPDNVKQCNTYNLFCSYFMFVNFNDILK